MENTSKIAVLGANGMVGRALVRRLKVNGYTNVIPITRKEADLTNQDDVEVMMGNVQPEYIFDAAAKVGGIHANNVMPAEFIYNNLAIQTNVIEACRKYDVKKLCFLGSVCFVSGTVIITKDGCKNIEDIKIGDVVLTHKNRFERVYKTTTNVFAKEIINVDLHGWNDVSCTPEHLFYTNHGWIPAKDLTVDDYVYIPRSRVLCSDTVNIINDSDREEYNAYMDIKSGLSTKDTIRKYKSVSKMKIYGWKRGTIPHFGFLSKSKVILTGGLAELCGYFVSEGCVNGKPSGIRGSCYNITFFPGYDETFANDISSKLKNIFGIIPSKRLARTSWRIGMNNKTSYSFFKTFYNNPVVHKAHTKKIPEFIMNSSSDSIKQFLRGYWRGDGHWNNRKDRATTQYFCTASSVSKEMVHQLQQLILKLDIFSTIFYHKKVPTCIIEGRVVNQRDQWEIKMYGKNALKFIREVLGEECSDIVYKNENYVHDYNKFDGNFLKVKIKTITRTPFNGVVYDLSVENDNSYTANGIAVHNCIYPKYAEVPVKEDSLLTGELEPTNQWYAIAKIAGIKMCQAYRRQYGCDFISVMPCNLCGEYDNFHPTFSHVIPALIRRFVEAKNMELPTVTVWGTGNARREFLFVDDMADACIFLMNNYSDEKIINIGYGEDCTIRELVETIAEVVDYKGTIIWDTSKPDGTPKRILDSSRLFKLGWKPNVSLKEGLTRAVNWYKTSGKDTK